MLGPYVAKEYASKRIIEYTGNKVYKTIRNVQTYNFDAVILEKRLSALVEKEEFYHLHKIDNAVFFAAIEYFKKIGAEWCNLPLTTLMISSPGEIYGGQTLEYTTDTLPVELTWFKNERSIFLSESSQFYLELRLLIDKVDKVFSIYNSFRKEKTDFSHLSEFQHIEFEGHISLKENIDIALGLLRYVTNYILKNNFENLLFFLGKKDIDFLSNAFESNNVQTLSFKEALEIIYKQTGDSIYQKFTLEHFGAWEEILLTNILGKHVILTEFPLLQIPFYHKQAAKTKNDVALAENADFILYGYREVIGAGARITDADSLAQKAKIFNLPLADYEPYLQTRSFKNYKNTAGFGMGWQRYTHWLLKLPFIWEASHIPRGHHLPKP